MVSEFSILFKYSGFLFIGEIGKVDMDGRRVYGVHYALASCRSSMDLLEIYQGYGKGGRTFWRQRIISNQTELEDPKLIKIIGQEIMFQEDIESRLP